MSIPSSKPLGRPAGGEDVLFEDLIAPISPERFFREHWETRPLVVARQDPGYFDRFFTMADVDRVLDVARSCPDDAITLGSADKPRTQAPAAEISREQIYRSFCEGLSLRISGVHRFWAPLGLLKSILSERLSTGISMELYLTPASSQGVKPHYDNRDVFVLQLYGSKRWHLGDPTYELPGVGLNHVAEGIPRQIIADDSPFLSDSVVLRAGDLFYLPRGFYHKPVAEDETSLHISIVINPVSWGALLTRAIEFVALKHLPLRRSLPPGFAAGPDPGDGMAETFAELLETFARDAPFEETLDNLIREQRQGELYPADGHFASLDRLSSVEAGTVLERRQGLTCAVETRRETAVIRFGPNYVSGPLALAPTFEFIRDRRSFRVCDLPGPLSDRSKAVLACRLIREGLLRLGTTP